MTLQTRRSKFDKDTDQKHTFSEGDFLQNGCWIVRDCLSASSKIAFHNMFPELPFFFSETSTHSSITHESFYLCLTGHSTTHIATFSSHTYPLSHTPTHSFDLSLTNWHTHPSTNTMPSHLSFARSLTHSLPHLPTPSPTHYLICPLIHPLSHSITHHPLTHTLCCGAHHYRPHILGHLQFEWLQWLQCLRAKEQVINWALNVQPELVWVHQPRRHSVFAFWGSYYTTILWRSMIDWGNTDGIYLKFQRQIFWHNVAKDSKTQSKEAEEKRKAISVLREMNSTRSETEGQETFISVQSKGVGSVLRITLWKRILYLDLYPSLLRLHTSVVSVTLRPHYHKKIITCYPLKTRVGNVYKKNLCLYHEPLLISLSVELSGI